MRGSRGDWPGRRHDLSDREAEVLALIAEGLSNKEIGATVFRSVNSIKTYIRTTYRKIGVHTRSQAVRWAMENGFAPRPSRRVVHSGHRPW
ncbi:response regulator transcription factor [Nocardioides sp. cx-169]|uniref:response regulator transcription factor n=1 Tax=Nocardioides sp. cx-169 TaxID=2899080 RepID=UPI001E28DABA|nr:response regulator transcription factor [Nocardioides sp. cx-169]MCD4534379.1 response regulator transcription factor [Nocardioides sp. cx-169]